MTDSRLGSELVEAATQFAHPDSRLTVAFAEVLADARPRALGSVLVEVLTPSGTTPTGIAWGMRLS